MKNVNAEQIKKIEKFLIKKDIIYDDIQVEFLDHICSGIEEQWEKDDQLPFDKAFHIEYKKFGIFGLHDIVEKREKSLLWHYWKQLGKHGLHWFKIPQIFFTILLGYSIYLILNTVYNYIFIDIIFGVICLSTFFQSFNLKYKQKKAKNNGQQILLMDKVILESQSSLLIIYIPFIQNLFSLNHQSFSHITTLIFSVLFTLILILFYLTVYDFPKNKTQYFKHKYSII